MSETNGKHVVENTEEEKTSIFSTLAEAKTNLEDAKINDDPKGTKKKWEVFYFRFPGEEQMKKLAGTEYYGASGGGGVFLGRLITYLKSQGFPFQLGKAESKKAGPVDVESVLEKMDPEERAALLAKYAPPKGRKKAEKETAS